MLTARQYGTAALLAVFCLALGGCQVSAGAAVPAAKPSQAPMHLVWSDEFNGKAGAIPSAANWNFETGANGWGNHELECYTSVPGNAATNGSGDLVITAIRQPGHVCSDGAKTDFTSARITTQHKFSTKYGRLEVRAKVPTASGTWPAFWALGTNIDTVKWPRAGEIDVMETIGKQPSTVHGTLHGPTAAGTAFSVATADDTGSNLGDAFHTYAANWTPTSVAFSIDGHVYGTVSANDVTRAGGSWVFTHDFYLLLNLAIGGDYPGPPASTTTWPQRYYVDYVRVYS